MIDIVAQNAIGQIVALAAVGGVLCAAAGAAVMWWILRR